MPDTEFDWKFSSESWEETPGVEADWSDVLPAPPDTSLRREAARRKGLRRRIALISLAVVALIGVGVYALIAQRIGEVTDPVKKEIRSAYELLQSALERSDGDLFVSLQSSDNYAGWRDIQRGMFGRGLLFERRLLELPLQSAEPVRVDVDFAPGETRAEALADYVYVTDAGNGVTQTVRLRQAMPYRFERQRWLLGPMDGAFWGERVTVENRFVALTYPERDEPVGRRLAGDLDRLLEKVCPRLVNLICPTRFPLRVRLSETSNTLVTLIDRATDSGFFDGLARQGATITLPAPTLIGVPTDEASYQAVYRLYAIQMLKALLAQQGGRHTTQLSWVYYQTALDNELVRLGLRSWPAAGVWHDPEPAALTGVQQDVALYCVEDGATGGSLLRYTPPTGEWRRELSGRIFLSLAALPQSDALVLQEQPVLTDPASARVVLWQDDVEHVLFNVPPGDEPDLSIGEADPSGRRLPVTLNAFNPSSSNPPQYYVLDLAGCDPAGCEMTSLPYAPVWSPDGSQQLLGDWEHGKVLLNRGDGQEPIEIDQGQNPFWLDNQTLGYIRQEYGPQFKLAVMTYSVEAAGEPQVLLDSDALAGFLPGEAREYQFYFGYAQVNPADVNQILVAAIASRVLSTPNPSDGLPDTRAYLFLFDRRSGELSLPLTFDSWTAVVEFSPDGHWLVASAVDIVTGARTLQFLNIEQGRTETVTLPGSPRGASFFTRHNWSSDGQWFMLLRDGVLYLIAPGQASQQTIVPVSPGCLFAAWVDRQ